MSITLKNRSFLSLKDFSLKEVRYFLDQTQELKIAKHLGKEKQMLKGKNIALVFEQPSIGTRCAFEVAIFDQGGQVSIINLVNNYLGQKDSIIDTARVLGKTYHGIGYWGYNQSTIELLAKYAGVPVWNGFTDVAHPTQVLADLVTMIEHCDKPLRKVSLCYIGNARNNVCYSLMEGASRLGMDFRIAAPVQYQPTIEFIDQYLAMAKESNGKIAITDDINDAVKGVDFLYTDSWISMEEPSSGWKERIKLLKPYRIDGQVINATGNPKVRFMHCLPAYHNRETEIGQEIYDKFGLDAMEVTDEVFESPASIVFDQAENRVHSLKAIILATLP